MSTKPSSLPIWATDGGAQITEPNLGKKQDGHVGGEPLAADYQNWWQNLVYLWAEYLSDGDLSGDHTIDGNLDVDGDLSATGSFSSGPAAVGDLTAVSADVAGDVEIGGRLRHPAMTDLIAAGAGYGVGTTTDLTTGLIEIPGPSGSVRWYIPVELPAGKRITSWSLRCFPAGGEDVQAEAFTRGSTGSLTSTTVTATSTGTGTQTITPASPFTHTMVAGQEYVVRVQASGDPSPSTMTIHWLEVTYDEPPP
jgi:hypothetical protein